VEEQFLKFGFCRGPGDGNRPMQRCKDGDKLYHSILMEGVRRSHIVRVAWGGVPDNKTPGACSAV
jgi:hypothetical protein